jgi:cellulose synthase/poly-beta-1,6-N-acetylglucosamine synthase-like glycosyltransferase
VVASFRRPQALPTVLASLSQQTVEPSEFEVAVVVDGIDDSEAEYR